MRNLKIDHFLVTLDRTSGEMERACEKARAVGYPVAMAEEKPGRDGTSRFLRVGDQGLKFVNCIGKGPDPGCVRVMLSVWDLDDCALRFRSLGLPVNGPERPTEPGFMGIMSRKLPWRELMLPPIPGTCISFGFVEYDEGACFGTASRCESVNASEVGIEGIRAAHIYLPRWREAVEFLRTVFEDLTVMPSHAVVKVREQKLAFYETGNDKASVHIEAATTVKHLVSKSFSVRDVRIENVNT